MYGYRYFQLLHYMLSTFFKKIGFWIKCYSVWELRASSSCKSTIPFSWCMQGMPLPRKGDIPYLSMISTSTCNPRCPYSSPTNSFQFQVWEVGEDDLCCCYRFCRPVSTSGQDVCLSQGVPSGWGNREKWDPSSQENGLRTVAWNRM